MSLLSTSDRILRDLTVDSALLDELRRQFARLLHPSKFRVDTFQEQKGFKAIHGLDDLIVKNASSSLDFAEESIHALNANHVDMCRLTGRHDPGYRQICRVLEEYMEDLRDGEAKQLATDCMEALAFPHMSDREESIKRQECKWLFENHHYIDWRSDDTEIQLPFLIIQGKPGSGKSVGLRTAAGHLEDSSSHLRSYLVLQHYFDGRGHRDMDRCRDAQGMYRTLLHQIIRLSRPSVPDAMRKIQHDISFNWDVERLQHALESLLIQAALPVILFIDAIDECKPRGDDGADEIILYLDRLIGRLKEVDVHLRICVTARHAHDLNLPIARARCITVEQHNHVDIAAVVERRLLCIEPRELRLQLKHVIEKKSSGLFQWTDLVTSSLGGSTVWKTNQEVLEQVRHLPEGLPELYTFILQNNQARPQEECYRLLQLVLVAKEKLRLTEIQDVLALGGLGELHKGCEWSDIDRTLSTIGDFSKRVVLVSGGLLHIESPKSTAAGPFIPTADGSLIPTAADEDSQYVDFIHLSVPEFLKHVDSQRLFSLNKDRDIQIEGHLWWVHLCVKILSTATLYPQHPRSILRYVCKHWMGHAREVDKILRKENFAYPTTIGKCSPRLSKWMELYNDANCGSGIHNAVQLRHERSALVSLAAEGCLHLMTHHCQACATCKIELSKASGASKILERALYYACANRRLEVIKFLAKLGGNGNAYVDGIHVLYNASWNGYDEVVDELLNMGADISATGVNQYYGFPLHAAVSCGRITVVRKLLEHAGLQVDRFLRLRNGAGETALQIAAVFDRQSEAEELLSAADDRRSYALMETGGFTAAAMASLSGNDVIAQLINDITES